MNTLAAATIVILLLAILWSVAGQFRSIMVPQDFPEDVDLATITPQTVDMVLADRAAVLQLVECFENEARCRSRGALSFARQVHRLGKSGRCHRCSPRQQQHISVIMRRTISGMQSKHPAEWRRIVPFIRNLL
ncbi:uncharacterized protein LOC108668557 [Hyalella azteca]|uniref:Uncharacterized protein LOC108668557 n=1 Tax=Hyalella azteca TaxID=294128 RepID=A0A8B7NCG5_HYAAZ|nr:uncharacterized protein LOC108668557 [Hyalella azteca]